MSLFTIGERRRKSHDRRNQLCHRRLAVEGLEDRCLLTVVSLIPIKDNTLIKDTSTTLGSTSNGAGDIFVGLNKDVDKTRRGVMEFDVAGSVPSGSTINSVTLTMWVNRNQSRTTMNVELHKLLAEWGEAGSSGGGDGGPAKAGDATWLHTSYANQFWATPGGDFSATVSGVQSVGLSNASYTWSSTTQMVADVQAWLNTPAANHGWLLKGNESTRSSHRFDSRTSATAAHRPTLTIDYSPAAAVPSISISDVTLVEGNTGTATATLNVALSAASSQAVTVNYATANGTAIAGSDYTAAGGTLTFTPGQTLKSISVPVSGDALVELNETFSVNLSVVQNATILDSQGVATISNDDSASLAINDVLAAEGNAGTTSFTFTVTLGASVDSPLTVGFSTADGAATTADNDYTAVSGTLDFAGNAGETKSITVNVTGDRKAELDESFTVNLANVVAAGRSVIMADGQGVGTLTNDDAALRSLTLNPVRDNTLIQNATGALSNGVGDLFVGQNGNGNLARRGLLAFDIAGSLPAGATVQSVTLTMYVVQTVVGDYPVELHPVLANWGEAGSTGSGTGGPSQTGDATWLHTFFNNQFWANAGGDFSATASAVTTVGSQGAFYTWNVTSQLVADVQKWLDQPATNFGWLMQADETHNSAKRFASREAADLAQRPALTIEFSENPPPEVSISDVVLTEGNAGSVAAQFNVSLSAPSTKTVTVDFATADGTATAGSDYLAAAGTVTFAPSETTQTISITVTGDPQVEPDEDFFVNLSNPTNATIADSQGIGTITDDDTVVRQRPWQNPRDRFDVNDADGITALDALIVINYINTHPDEVVLPASPGTSPPYYDVSGDDVCTAMDVLQVINCINGQASGAGVGEANALVVSSSVPIRTPTADGERWPDQSESNPVADPADPPTRQQELEKPLRSASYWPATNEASQAVSRRTSDQGEHRDTDDQESPFDCETDFSDLESVLSDMERDVGRSWKRS